MRNQNKTTSNTNKSELFWIVKNNWTPETGNRQTRENVYGEVEALRRLVELNDNEAYIWTPGAYAIELSEAKRMLRQAEGRLPAKGF